MNKRTLRIATLSALLISGCAYSSYAQMPKWSTYPEVNVQQEVRGMKVHFLTSIDDAFKKAKKQKKLVFVNFYQDWAIPCHTMMSKVYSDKELSDFLNKNFINLFINADESEGYNFTNKYHANMYAHALVLDAEGNVVLRIVGGSPAKDFKEQVALALSDKTSLKGTETAYESGKRDKETLSNYLNALQLANDNNQFSEVAKEYFTKLTPEEYSQKQNWKVVKEFVKDRSNEMYSFLLAHKADFVKNNGESSINNFISRLFLEDASNYVLGFKPYTPEAMDSLRKEVDAAGLPKDNYIYDLMKMGQMRGEKRYADMIAMLKTKDAEWATLADNIRSTLNIPDLNDADRKLISDYLKEDAAKHDPNGNYAKRTMMLAAQISKTEGIKFEGGTFSEALEKAKAENKKLFLDCYTSWCGPCKMMASQVFTQPQVGQYFKDRLVAIKIDMEKGEGVSLAKKYKVAAYPTMLIINSDGTVNARITGARPAPAFIDAIHKLTNPATGYEASIAAWNSGKINGDVIKNYTYAKTNAGEMNEIEAEKIVNNFLKKLTDEQFVQKENWGLISEYAEKSPSIRNRVFSLQKELVANNDEQKINKAIERIVFMKTIAYLQDKANVDSVRALFAEVQKIGYPEDYSLTKLQQVFELSTKKDNNKILDYYENEVSSLTDLHARLNIDILLPYFSKTMTYAQKNRAIQYAQKENEKGNDRSKNSYDALISVLPEGK